MKKKKNSIQKDVIDLTKTQVGLTAGTMAVGSMGGDVAPLTTFGRHMPMMAGLKATGHVMKGLRLLHPKRKKKRR